MQKKRPWLSSLIAVAAVAAVAEATAAGPGVGGTAAVLGQALDFAVQMRLEPGETLSPDCIAAEVSVGERRLTPAQIRTSIESQSAEMARIRVQTTQVIDEPVVSVQLGAGCASRQIRRFVLLADPPAMPPPSAAAPPPAAVTNLPDAAQLTAATAAGPAAMGAEAPVPRAEAVPLARAEVAPPRTEAAPSLRADAAAGLRADVAPGPRTDAAPRRSVTTPVPAASTRRIAARDEAPQASAAAASVPVRSARRERRPPEHHAAVTPRKNEAPLPARAASAAASDAATAAPRLKLDFEEPAAGPAAAAVEEALQAVAMAASSARAAASAASAASDRIAALEHTVDELRSEATASHLLVAELRARENRSEDAGRWTYPLLGAVLVLAGLSAWLGWRLAAAQQQRQMVWRAAASPPPPLRPAAPVRERPAPASPTAPIPFVTTETRPPLEPAGPRPAWPPAAPPDSRFGGLPDSVLPPIADTVLEARPVGRPEAGAEAEPEKAPVPSPAPALALAPKAQPEREGETATQRTEPMPQSMRTDGGAARDVSIEELIDLEQQAEFFVVLGQDEAAVDLLVEHLRHTGGSSPLPYLKLLEIYHRRGDRDDYERTRARFNLRFNAYAPDWGVDLQAGRSLEDYAGIVPRLQQAWSRPLDAMAELEALLFRKSVGELFDLPAYREVLLLYSLARDLHDREAVDAGNVDLLLPLADVGDFGATTAAPYLGLRPMPVERLDRHELYDPPTAPVDFDLSKDTDRPTSIFDPLDEEPRPPRR